MKKITPPIWLLVCGILSGFLLLLLRTFDVQVIRGDQFLAAAEANRFFTLPIVAPRGVLLDRYGDPLVKNQRTYLQLSDEQALFSRTTLLDPVDALPQLATRGASIEKSYQRAYPWGETLAHTLGYVGAVTAEDLHENSSLAAYHQIGKYGLEQILDQQLRGQDGSIMYEVDARLQRKRVAQQRPAIPGTNVQTSLDPYLAQRAYELLGDQQGAVVISDALTGEILALASKPSFDPAILSQVQTDEVAERLRRSQVQALFNDPKKPFFNRAISGSYPPGSVFKLVTSLAGLETDAITTQTTVVDEGVLTVGDFKYGNWYYRQYGRTEGEIGLVRSIARSNDIFFYKAAEWTGPTKLAEMARLFGLGKPTGIELFGEASGLVPDPAWKEKTLGERWYLGNTYHVGIGQGDLLVSPLQQHQLTQALAHQGVACQPKLLQESEVSCQSLGLQEKHVDTVLSGMLDACSPGGTAYSFFERNGNMRQEDASPLVDISRGAVACKTGTAEFGGVDEQGYRNTHGWFVAIVEPQLTDQTQEIAVASESADVSDIPQQVLHDQWRQRLAEHPLPRRLVITVLVESNEEEPFKEGSGDAAPIAKGLLDWMEGT